MPNLTDTATLDQVTVAEYVVATYGETIRYSKDGAIWLHFTPEAGWTYDKHLIALTNLVIKSLGELQEMAPEDAQPVKATRFASVRTRSVQKLRTHGAINSIIQLMTRMSELHVTGDQLDKYPTLLGVPNGILDLRTGKVAPFDRATYVLRRVPIKFDSSASCPRFERFLREVFGDDEGVQTYLHRWVGYMLTGLTVRQEMWLLVGSGSNGKSTFIKTLQWLLGPDYAQQAPESVLLARPTTGSAQSELVRLAGVRLVALTETNEGQAFNESRVKALVSGDTIAARPLYGDFLEFEPQAKYLLATNHLPKVTGSDRGIWRRLVVVPFGREFSVGADQSLAADLRAELPGILAWAVRGAHAFLAHGLPATPKLWQEATDEYRWENDDISAFAKDSLEFRTDLQVSAQDLYGAYAAWAVSVGRRSMDQGEFGRRMAALPGVDHRRHGKARRAHYFGVGLRPVTGEQSLSAELFDGEAAASPGPSFVTLDGLLSEATA
jgi:putative DNA primase/helicase